MNSNDFTVSLLLQVHRNKDMTISLKLADFGLAMDVKEAIYTVCGTPTYVAPEILSEIGTMGSMVYNIEIFSDSPAVWSSDT